MFKKGLILILLNFVIISNAQTFKPGANENERILTIHDENFTIKLPKSVNKIDQFNIISENDYGIVIGYAIVEKNQKNDLYIFKINLNDKTIKTQPEIFISDIDPDPNKIKIIIQDKINHIFAVNKELNSIYLRRITSSGDNIVFRGAKIPNGQITKLTNVEFKKSNEVLQFPDQAIITYNYIVSPSNEIKEDKIIFNLYSR